MGSNNVEDQPPTSNLGSTKGLVTINPAKTYKDDAALTADTVIAEVELVATSSTTVREGLDLVAVLDISGSMSGVKIDSVKKAMAFVIMKLTPVDRLSIVTFSDAAATVTGLRSMTPANQTDLIAKVNGLNAGGGTHIQAGLEAGLAVLSSRVHKTARAANIFLMSDGDHTSGDARLVNPGQVPIYTFGFGKDANHQLMSDIATKSPGGTFSSVPDGSPVTVTFSQLLAGLVTIVAQDVQLTLTMSSYTDDTESIVVSPGIDYTQTTDAAGDVTIKFGNLFAGEKRRVQMTIKLKDITETYTDDDGFTATLAEAQHRFTAQGKPSNLQLPEYIQVNRTKNPSQAPGTTAKEREVQAEMARLQHADAIKQARVLADGGKLDDARYKLVDAQNALEDMVPLGDGMRLVNALRAELVQLIRLMDSEAVYKAQGRPYALASETCHGRQRYAARGGDDDVRLFATPRMDTYREQAQSFEKDPTAPVPTADEDVKKEVAANPLAAISTELAFYLRNAIQALQAIERIVAPKA